MVAVFFVIGMYFLFLTGGEDQQSAAATENSPDVPNPVHSGCGPANAIGLRGEHAVDLVQVMIIRNCFLKLTWGRCYDHNFLRFFPIFGEKIDVFLKYQCYDQLFSKFSFVLSQKRRFFRKIFRRKYFKIITSVLCRIRSHDQHVVENDNFAKHVGATPGEICAGANA
jgi:hypothetical protein